MQYFPTNMYINMEIRISSFRNFGFSLECQEIKYKEEKKKMSFFVLKSYPYECFKLVEKYYFHIICMQLFVVYNSWFE